MSGSVVPKNKVLSVFSLVMINVIAVDSLRTLPISAKFGYPLIFYYVVIALLFFFPVALVTAELATTWPKRGGIYVWVREAFGHQMGFLVVWLQWMYNLAWYPTILGIIASIIAYLFDAPFLTSPVMTCAIVLVVFWLSTLANCFGMELSSWISAFCTWVGTLIPMVLIIFLGGWWLYSDHLVGSELTVREFLPQFSNFGNLAFLNGIMFGLMGLEMSAVHAQEVKDPRRDYPLALKYSVIIILSTLMLGSVAVAIVVPPEELNIITGVVQAFEYFFDELGIPWMLNIISIAIIIGAFGAIAAWIIGPTKALLVAAQEENLPKILAKTNKHGVPVPILIMQGVIVSILSLSYIILPTQTAYFILQELTAILALLMHVLLFVAAIKLRYKHPQVERPYRIPGGVNLGMWIVTLVGGVCSIAAIFLAFVPPPGFSLGAPMNYQLILVAGIVIFCLPAYFVHKRQRKIATIA